MSNPSEIFSPGYVSGRAIQDVFTFRISQLQHEILPDGTPNRRRIIEFVDALRAELLSRCEQLPQAKARPAPQPPAAPKAKLDGEEPLVPDSREEYSRYAARNRRT